MMTGHVGTQRGDERQAAAAVAGVAGRLPGTVVADLDPDVPGRVAVEAVGELAGFAAMVGVLDGVGGGLTEGELQVVGLIGGQGGGVGPAGDAAAQRTQLGRLGRQSLLQRAG
jgi:hypothetical protein